jgi:hypothetical protein
MENNYSDFKVKTINTLIRQSARWALAAQQDQSPIIALLHANYAAGYLWALKDIATDTEIAQIGGVDPLKFRNQVIAIQDRCTKRVSKICPKFIGKLDHALLRIAGDL